MPVLNFLFQIAVSGRDDTYIHLRWLGISHLNIFSGFEHTQQTRLQVEGHFTDFIQKNRTVICHFKQAGLVFHGSGKGSGLVTKELTLQQVFAESRTVDGHNRILTARARVMDSVGEHFLSGTGFTREQHRHIRIGHFPGQRNRLLQSVGTSDNRIKRIGYGRSDLSFLFFYLIHRTTDCRNNLAVVISLSYVIKCPVLNGLHPIRNIAVSGKQNHLRFRTMFFYLPNEIDSVSIGEKHVTKHHIKRLCFQQFQCTLAVTRFPHLVAFQLNHARQQVADGIFIINH